MADKKQNYGADQIQVLEGLEPVRKRPGMYIGGTGKDGLHHMIKEVADNGIDEAIAGFATEVAVILNEDGSVTVTDDGRGIPVEKHKKTGKSTLETVLTVLHAGGKFGDGGYKVSSGLHGVGVSVVNALSNSLIAEIHKDGDIYTQEYARGAAQGELKKGGKTKESGTKITFSPDDSIFSTVEWDFDWVVDYLRHQAYLTKGIKTRAVNKVTDQEYTFYFEGGIQSYVRHLNIGKDVPSMLKSEGLPGALRDLAERTAQAYQIKCTAECPETLQIADLKVVTHLYRIAQEAVNNAVNHADPRMVTIRLSKEQKRVKLEIEDDGSGIAAPAQSSGMGLLTMAHRAQMIGGDFDVHSGPDGGTRIQCEIPLT